MASEVLKTQIGRPAATPAPWAATVAKYKRSNTLASCWQIANTLLPLFGMWYLMYLSLGYSYWLTLLLAVPTAGFRVRVFIIQHDCGHHSFFRNRRANDLLGTLCGIITLTPYDFWKRTHARHHVSSGNLDCRGQGDVGTLTVYEYLQRSRWGRLRYRLYRHPAFMFGLGASYFFLIQNRITRGIPRSWRRERRSVHVTNLGILVVLCLAAGSIGLVNFLLVEFPVAILGSAIGTWMFYIQHQFDEAYWRNRSEWEFTASALDGSSYYHLPRVLQWFTGNIGFHHIHHLNSRIPNYHLPACYAAEPAFRRGVSFGLWESLRLASLKLWDERTQRMVGFAEIRGQSPSRQAAGISPDQGHPLSETSQGGAAACDSDGRKAA